MKSPIFLSIILFFLFVNISYADWQSTLSSKFDIAVTFDDCSDWKPSTAYGMDDTNPSDMPVCESKPPLNYYSDWDPSAPSGPYISSFSSKVGDAGKSLRIDVNASGDYGPSRIGGYFGDGSAKSGYSDIYFFYRAYFPAGYFPGDLVYEKLLNLGHGFTAPLEWNGLSGAECNADGESCRMPYGITSFVPQAEWGGPQFRLRSADYYSGSYPYSDEKTSGTVAVGKWVTFEYHLTLNDATADSDKVEIWMYDDNGKATSVFSDSAIRLHNLSASSGHKYNWFFIGGNSDQGGVGTYYVDDIIINDSRIGPTYFDLLGGGSVVSPPVIEPPPNVKLSPIN